MPEELVGFAPDGLEIPAVPSQLVGIIITFPDLPRCEIGESFSPVCELDDIPTEGCVQSVEPPDETCRETPTSPDETCREDITIPDEPCRQDPFDIG